MSTEGATVPALIEAVIPRVSSPVFLDLRRLMAPEMVIARCLGIKLALT
jgi:hypothetical protein